MRPLYILALPACLIGVLASCGGDKSSTSGDAATPESERDAGKSLPQSSGVAATKRINELSEAEIDLLCAWWLERVGGKSQVTCPNGVSAIQYSGAANCRRNALNNNARCTKTVASWETCARALTAADPCGDGFRTAQSSSACSDYLEDVAKCSEIR